MNKAGTSAEIEDLDAELEAIFDIPELTAPAGSAAGLVAVPEEPGKHFKQDMGCRNISCPPNDGDNAKRNQPEGILDATEPQETEAF